MDTKHGSVTAALLKLYPTITADVLDRMAKELIGILDRGLAEGWQMDTVHLFARKHTPLGLSLKEYRERAGFQQKDVAKRADWSVSKVLRIETGQVAPTVADVRYLLNLYGVNDPAEKTRLENLAREGNRQGGRRGPRI